MAAGDGGRRGVERGGRRSRRRWSDSPRRRIRVASRWCSRTTTRPTAPPSSPRPRRRGWASTTGECSSPSRASSTRSTGCSTTMTTPLVVTVDADTLPLPRGAHATSSRGSPSDPQDQHVCACAGAIVVENAAPTSSPGCSSGTTGWASTASSGCRPPTTAPSSPRAPSPPTGPRTSARSAAGRTRSARTSC